MITRFGPFALDTRPRQLTRDGTEVHLTPKAFDLLALLVCEAPRVVSKNELHQRLWPETFVSDATLVGLVKELRRALDDHDPHAPLIRTVHRVGYAFRAQVDAASHPGSEHWHWIVADARRIRLHDGENLIGRDPASDVWLDFPGVSRHHARIVIGDSGAQLEDLGSKNGTKVGGTPVAEQVALGDGDRIHIGSILIVYRSSRSGISTQTQAGRTDPRSNPVARS